MSVSIPHLYYPHIVEAIIDNCSPESLNAFRGASRSFRDLVDSKYLEHITLVQAPPTDKPGDGVWGQRHDNVLVYGHELRVRIPCIASLRYSRRSGLLAPISAPSSQPHTAGYAEYTPERVLHLMDQHTHVVDLVGDILRVEIGRVQLSSMHTLRLRPDEWRTRYPWCPWEPKTLVLFSAPMRGRFITSEITEWTAVPSRTERVILNHVGTTVSPLHFWRLKLPKTRPVEVVNVFPEYTPGLSSGRFAHWSPNNSSLAYDLSELIYHFPTARFTLVGMDELSSEYAARFLSLLRQGIEEALDEYQPQLDPAFASEQVESLMKSVKTLSMERYAELVNNEHVLALQVVAETLPEANRQTPAMHPSGLRS